MSTVILFGTESGTAEFVAEDLAEALEASGELGEVQVADMATCAVEDLRAEKFYVVVCSTYGEGDLPASARPFREMLEREEPDLAGLRYAVFGMGDSSYPDTYSRGSEIVDRLFTRLGGQRVGEYGRHDASGREGASDAALAWLKQLVPELLMASRQ